jgi:hypothetical protein
LASKHTNLLASLARYFFPLIGPVCILGKLFSELARGNSELLASLASVLKKKQNKLSTPLHYTDTSEPVVGWEGGGQNNIMVTNSLIRDFHNHL